MKKKTILSLIIGFGATLHSFSDESKEPALLYDLIINGETNSISVNQTIQLTGTYTAPKINFKKNNYRLFDYGNIEFKYPSELEWESVIEASDDKKWTLSGGGFDIQYIVLPEIVTLEQWCKSIAETCGDFTFNISGCERNLGHIKYKGEKIISTIYGHVFIFELYALPSKAGSKLFMFKYRAINGEPATQKASAALKLLTASFVNKD